VWRIKERLYELYEEHVIDLLMKARHEKVGKIFWELNELKVNTLKSGDTWHFNLDEEIQQTHDLDYFIEKKIKLMQADMYNFECSMVLYQHKERLYVQFFGIDRFFPELLKYIEGLKKRKIIEDYWYQNQASFDGDDDDWYKEREILWDEIYKKSDIPSIAGFSFDFWHRETLWKFYHKLNEIRKAEKVAEEALKC
jgi:hypothetical protein